jgi:hypothetical protein
VLPFVQVLIIQQSQFVVNCFLVRPEEFESPTSRLRRPVFYPVELETHCMAPVGGIEPPLACADRVPITLQPGLNWCHELDSNQPHTDFQSAALPDELPRQIVVSMARFERAASSFQTRPSTRLTLHRDKMVPHDRIELP